MKTAIERRLRDPEFARLFAEEKFVIDVLESICEWMDEKGVSRADLARRLGTSRSNVTQILNGRNVSLRKIAAVVHVLDGEPTFGLCHRISRSADSVKPKVIQMKDWSPRPGRPKASLPRDSQIDFQCPQCEEIQA